MSTREKLQITIVTFNRARHLAQTLATFTAPDSPVRDHDILVLDNASTDETGELVTRLQAAFPRLSYQRNPHNVGALANIAKAFEGNRKEHLWIVADDDVYDWSAWPEVEAAIAQGEPAILISRMELPAAGPVHPGQLLHQAALISACIFSRSLLNATVFRNLYDQLHTMFPHLIPLVQHLNDGGRLHVIRGQIVQHGSYVNQTAEDISWSRGVEEGKLYRKSLTMSFEVGFAIAISHLRDERLRQETLEWLLVNLDARRRPRSVPQVLGWQIRNYAAREDLGQLVDLYVNIGPRHRTQLAHGILGHFSVPLLLGHFPYRLYHQGRDRLRQSAAYRKLKELLRRHDRD
jgi:glycosyltransferase involved in cell wall biosynthesis